jgi:hypothetical protein
MGMAVLEEFGVLAAHPGDKPVDRLLVLGVEINHAGIRARITFHVPGDLELHLSPVRLGARLQRAWR